MSHSKEGRGKDVVLSFGAPTGKSINAAGTSSYRKITIVQAYSYKNMSTTGELEACSYREWKSVLQLFLKTTCIFIMEVRFCTPTPASRATSSTRWAIALNCTCMFIFTAPTCKAGTEMIVKETIPASSSGTILAFSTNAFEDSTLASAARFGGIMGLLADARSAWVAGKMCRPTMTAHFAREPYQYSILPMYWGYSRPMSPRRYWRYRPRKWLCLDHFHKFRLSTHLRRKHAKLQRVHPNRNTSRSKSRPQNEGERFQGCFGWTVCQLVSQVSSEWSLKAT
ncbi:uncharacterized protein EV420DRAFT_896566 [Desarmillaria tabescens]|uniref:Uncharacterized protein n=1 Tax=Armillaria tabescens TaxID=1929756 RepID=A0AA39MUD6_ARMTA|nr:uncharacterized protein EV420DRAFT_896566 [Desarmillaria tabescens]KAK0446568.1 hypothetical protein EV420DRAFT_896566 [Desarmillaria tabescens]